MGFNARLAPYTVTKTFLVEETSNDAATSQHFEFFRFPAAGQLVSAYANLHRLTIAGTAAIAAVEAETATGVDEISIWKHATDDTTATYATALRAAARTGDQDTSTSDGINWRLVTTAPGTYTTETGMYLLTNKTSARRKFNAGDKAYVHFGPYGATDAHRQHQVTVQMDYIIGYEA